MFRYFVIASVTLTVIGGIVGWFNGVRYQRDRDSTSPLTPREIWYGSVRGPYMIIAGLIVAALFALGVAEFMCVLSLAVLLFPESLFWNLDDYTRPITLKCSKSR